MSGKMRRDDFITDPFLKPTEVPKEPGKLKKFLERLSFQNALRAQAKVMVPPIYIWEDEDRGVITGCVKSKFGLFGESYHYDANFVRRSMDKKKLFWKLREVADVLTHHGKQVLDNGGNIDSRKVNDAEALRWKHDRLWSRRVAAFQKVCKFKEISKDEAKRLNLL